MNVLDSEQMNFLDRQTIEQYGIPGLLLMERASLAVFEAGMKMLKKNRLKQVLIFCGRGNNGGDGFAAARHFDAADVPVTIMLLGDPASLKGDALTNYNMLINRRIPILNDLTALGPWESKDLGSVLLIDALFGTGLERALTGEFLKAVEWMNERAAHILAVDIPSGIHSNTSHVLGQAVRASKTVTFQFPKVGNISYPGAVYNGILEIASIGIPTELTANTPHAARVFDEETIDGLMPSRPVEAHKGTFGTLLIMGGVEGYSGAGILAARAAQRSGTGLIKTAVRERLNLVYETSLPEAVTLPIGEDGAGFSEDGLKRLRPEWQTASAVIAGPGWGQDSSWEPILKEFLLTVNKPLLLDADALNLLVPHMDWLIQRKEPAVITPHPGEMARLTGLTIDAINNNRLDTAKKAARDWQSVVVLKGAGTIIASPEGEAVINLTGNQGMAKAGSGDVLAGVIGSLMAQGMESFEAAAVGCWIHGRAGDLAVSKVGPVSLTAGDLIDMLPDAFMKLPAVGGGIE
ncbi:MAG: NAD(P)H-hydrate dehydratase [Bacillota bacterium]|nr:NAD(P)H-hydrate dehydratase [Bacillota bacterium]